MRLCAHMRGHQTKERCAPRLRTKTHAKHSANLRQCIYSGRELNVLLRLARLNPVAIRIPALKQQWQPRKQSLNTTSDFSENRTVDKQNQNTNSDFKLAWRNARSCLSITSRWQFILQHSNKRPSNEGIVTCQNEFSQGRNP